MTSAGETRNDAVITGAGVVAPLAVGLSSFWEQLLARRDVLACSPESRFGAPVPEKSFSLSASGFDIEDHADYGLVRRWPRFSSISLVAAQEAMKRSEFPEDAQRENSGVVLGTAFSASEYHFEYFEGLFFEGLREASPLLFSESVMNGASGHISHQLNLRGPGLTLIGSEDVGLHALSAALDQLRLGEVCCVIAGGSDEYCDVHQTSLASYGVLSGEASRPFSAGSPPAPVGEGACFFVMETESGARDRGARILARVLGSGYGRRLPQDPAGEAVTLAVRTALVDAGVDVESIGLVVSGAAGGELDRLELDGLTTLFDVRRPLMFAVPKQLLGEAFGFSSAAQALVGAMALATETVPGFGAREDSLLPEAWRVPEESERLEGDSVLVLSATREGGATAVILGSA